jgi:hypothetical protein
MKIKLILASFLIATPAIAADQGYFKCLLLTTEQAAWFAQNDITQCCDLADGMPTRYEERNDGTYVPPFSEDVAEAKNCKEEGGSWDDVRADEPDHSHWVRVPDAAVLHKPNVIGFAVVWWTNSYSMSSDHTVRCFVGVART